MKSLVIIFSTLLCLLAVNAAKLKSTKQNNEELSSSNVTSSCATISNQISPLIEPALLVGSDSWPTSVETINKHCELGAKVHKGFKRYGKCFTGIGRQAFNIFNRGLKKYMQNICSSEKKKQDTAEILKCAANETIGGWSKCLNKANQRLDITATNASDPNMVGNICCTYSAVLDCVALNTGSSPECGKTRDPSKFLQSSISFVLKDLIELLCANYETKEACVTNAANQANIADDSHQVNGTFILSPLIKAANLLGEVHADSI